MQSSRTSLIMAVKLLCFLIFTLITVNAAGTKNYPVEGNDPENGTTSHHNTSDVFLLQTRQNDQDEGKNDSTDDTKHIRRRRWSWSWPFGKSSKSSSDRLTNTEKLDESLDANKKLEMGTRIKNYYSIFQALSSKNELQSPKILSLSLEVYDIYIDTWTQHLKNYSEPILRLHNEMKPSLQSFLEKWADLVLKDNYGDIVTYSKTSGRGGNAVKHFLPQLIQKVYEKGNKVDSVAQLLSFLSPLPWLVHRAVGYMSIFQEMKNNRDVDNHYQITMLAYEVHFATKIGNKAHVVSEAAHLFEAIKTELPEGVRKLLWDSNIILENVEHKGYTLYGKGSISLYPHNNVPGGTNQKWKVVPVESGRYFIFQNAQTNNSLSTGNAKSEHQKHWQVFPVDGSTSFRLLNRQYDKCLDVNQENKSCRDSRSGRCYSTGITPWNNKKVSQKWKIL